MRRASTACTRGGTICSSSIPGRSAAVSRPSDASIRTVSATKNGLPPVRVRIASIAAAPALMPVVSST